MDSEQSKPPEMKRERDPGDGEQSREGAAQEALEGIASLERLRDRIETAARHMTRLRKENAALAERIKELETRPAVDPNSTFLTLDEEPEQLKRRVTAFIEAIDRYLESERSST